MKDLVRTKRLREHIVSPYIERFRPKRVVGQTRRDNHQGRARNRFSEREEIAPGSIPYVGVDDDHRDWML